MISTRNILDSKIFGFLIVCSLISLTIPGQTKETADPQSLIESAYQSLQSSLSGDLLAISKNIYFYFPSDRTDSEDFYPHAHLPPGGTPTIVIPPSVVHLIEWTASTNPNPITPKALRQFLETCIAHGLIHVQQLLQDPSRDNEWPKNPCPEGLCDQQWLQRTKRKISDEHQAAAFTRNYLKDSPEILASTLEAAEPSPELRQLIARLRELSSSWGAGQALPAADHVIFEAQYELPQVVLTLVGINGRLEQTFEGAVSPEIFTQQITDLKSQWQSYQNSPWWNELLKAAPYMNDVTQRYEKELTTFQHHQSAR